MLAMDKIHSIRQFYYDQGKTIPKIITETGHDRKTITKYLDMTDFNAPEPVTPDPEGICPKLEPYKSLIDTWLMEDKKVPRKQRHTARRVYRRLGKEADGFDCSYRLVAQYVAFRKSQMHLDNRKGYLPLLPPPEKARLTLVPPVFTKTVSAGKENIWCFPFHTATAVTAS